MEPITTTIAAVTAASNAIGWIRQNIDNISSVGELGEKLSTLFAARDKLNADRNKQAGVSDINIRSSIDAVIEAKKLNEELARIAELINNRFPKKSYDEKSAWQEILDLHNQKLKEAKEAKIAAQREAARKQHEMEESIKAFFLIAGFMLLVGLFFVGLFWIIVKG
jgi:hypothetical protein